MKIEGAVGLVSGANRGLGAAFAEALLAAGANKVYAGARDPSAISDPRVTPVKRDVTSPADIASAAARCGDVTILVNNAGIMLRTAILGDKSDEALHSEFEVNVFGTLAMMRAFAPILRQNGGGAIVNMLSVASWITSSLNATYGASKHAALAVTDAARIELRAQNTQVIGVYAGFIDTSMAAGINVDKVPPRQVAERAIEGIVTMKDHVLADERSENVWRLLRSDPAQLELMQQQTWDHRAELFRGLKPT